MLIHKIRCLCDIFKPWKLLLFIGFCAVLLKFIIITQGLYPSIPHLTELHKCPACYGVSACHDIHKVNLLWDEVNAVISNLFGVKNVFFGTYNGSKVVLKKLAHSSELNAFDVTLCGELQSEYPCSNVVLGGHALDFRSLIQKTVTPNFSNDDSSRLRLCPTARHLDDLLDNVHRNNKHINRTEYLINLWTLVSVNPEPLILQILPAENGWPVPKYYGSCGRIIMEEYVGLPLINYYDKPWTQRAKIVSSLLYAAYTFTFENEKFGFYLTDVSVDNIAVGCNNVAKLVDLENIIVVDKNPPQEDRTDNWQNMHKSMMHFDCPNCFAFSAEDICNHHLSDHNYYAICQLVYTEIGNSFPRGFLHDTPVNIQRLYPNIEFLLQQCAVPTSANSRIFFGQQLKALLDTILEEMPRTEHSEMK